VEDGCEIWWEKSSSIGVSVTTGGKQVLQKARVEGAGPHSGQDNVIFGSGIEFQ